MKYKTYTCTKCKTRFEDFGLNKGKQICPSCANPNPDNLTKDIDFSKTYDENLRDLVKNVRKENDKSK